MVSVHVESLLGVPSARACSQFVCFFTELRMMREDIRLNIHGVSAERQVFTAKNLGGNFTAEERVPRLYFSFVEPQLKDSGFGEKTMKHHTEMMLHSVQTFEE